MKTILEDTQEIEAVWLPGAGGGFRVGPTTWGVECDKIEAYGEPGQNTLVPWFAIWKNSRIVTRVNAAACEEVCYRAIKKETPGE